MNIKSSDQKNELSKNNENIREKAMKMRRIR